jgi:hypothetical protein
VALPTAFSGVVDFYFPLPVPVTPGTVYYFEPLVQSGDLWRIDIGEYMYSRGAMIVEGDPNFGSDLWFREGIHAVPEPSVGWLALLGVPLLWWMRRWSRR